MSQAYDASAIEVLTGLEPVRKRPGMYTDTTRPNHLAQEVIDNSVDEAMNGHATEIELVLHKELGLAFPRAVTPTHYIAMGMDPDLDDAARQALRDMIAWLAQLKGWTPEEAYVFCSLACDLHVTQLVDGNKGIHAMVSRALLG